MKNKKLARNLKIFGTVFILATSSYAISDKTIRTSNLFNMSIEQEQNIDNLNDYVLQGLCKVDDKYLLTAYDCNHNNNSIIYILDEDLKTYTIKNLDIYSHVGGITYDPIHNNIWVTDTDGTISAYDKDEVLSYRKNLTRKYSKLYVGNELENYYGVTSAAYITYNDNKLYIGNFNDSDDTIIKIYNIKDDGTIDRPNYKWIKISEYIQGISFYEDEKNDKKYLIVSSSYGKAFHSKLQFYDCDTYKKVQELYTKHMMEELIVDDDKLITIYESNAKIYNGNKKEADIIISNIDKLLTKK